LSLKFTIWIQDFDLEHCYDHKLHLNFTLNKVPVKETLYTRYKSCHDYKARLAEGVVVTFRYATSERGATNESGSFTISELPRSDGVLLLVATVVRDGDAISFRSHIYQSLRNSQLAVVDAFIGGSDESELVISDIQAPAHRPEVQANLTGKHYRFSSKHTQSVFTTVTLQNSLFKTMVVVH
jgi:hypothetical protein